MLCHIKGTVKENKYVSLPNQLTVHAFTILGAIVAWNVGFLSSSMSPVDKFQLKKNVLTTTCSGTLHVVGCGRFLIIKIFSYVCAIVSVA
jgi:hypothetical protein